MNNSHMVMIFILIFGCVFSGRNKTLTILHITSWEIDYDTESILDFAVTQVNQRTDILPDIQVDYKTFFVGHENVGAAMKAFIDGVSREPVKCCIFGPMYSSQAEVVAETASYYHLVEMGYSTSSPILSDTNKYPYFARTYDSSANNNLAILKVLEHFGWEKIAAIAYDVVFVASTKDDLITRLQERNGTVLISSLYTHDPFTQMQLIKKSNARIIVTYGRWESDTLGTKSRLLCQAYKLGLYGRRYQWLDWDTLYGVLRELEVDPKDGCTRDEMLRVTDAMFTFAPKSISDHDYYNTVVVTGKTAYAMEVDYKQFLNDNNDTYSYISPDQFLLPGVFDGAWSLFLAMNQTESDLEESNGTLMEFTYENQHYADLLYRNLINLQFFGLSGQIEFDEQGDKLTEINVYQIRNGDLVLVGEYNPFIDSLNWFVEESYLFKGHEPPLDADILRLRQLSLPDAMVTTTWILASLGIVYGLVGAGFMFYFRNTKYIRMSSPRLNYLISLGCILSYVAVILWNFDTGNERTQKLICQVRVWLLTCGFTLVFGSLFSKTWRVYKVAITKSVQKKIITDGRLLMVVAGMLTLDIIILITWQHIDEFRWKRIVLDITDSDENHDGIIYQQFIFVCSSKYSTHWSGVLYTIKGLLLIFGSFFAWQTRDVQIEGLNDSKQIGISVYNILIASLLTVTLVNILPSAQINVIRGITVVSIVACSTLTLTLVFGTKMYTMLLHGNKVDTLVTHKQATIHSTIHG